MPLAGGAVKRRLARSLLVALAFATSASRAVPLGDNLVRLEPSPFKLPQNIGPLRYEGENRYRDRRLGRSFSYAASGITLGIYVYDFGIAGIPDGPDSVVTCQQFESAKSEIEHGGNYRNVVLRAEASRPLREQSSLVAREAMYELDRNGIHATSLLWLTAAGGYFFKLRLSLRSEVADELDEAREQVLTAIATALSAPRPRKPETRAAAPIPGSKRDAAAAAIEFDATLAPDEGASWLVYANELVRYAGEHPEVRPPCGGLLVPAFQPELVARRAALAAWRAQPGERSDSNYFALLSRVDEAGFLDEYVWYYLRDARRDGAPPASLDLAGFESFRARELASHVPQSGAHVRFDAVRILPLETAP